MEIYVDGLWKSFDHWLIIHVIRARWIFKKSSWTPYFMDKKPWHLLLQMTYPGYYMQLVEAFGLELGSSAFFNKYLRIAN